MAVWLYILLSVIIFIVLKAMRDAAQIRALIKGATESLTRLKDEKEDIKYVQEKETSRNP